MCYAAARWTQIERFFSSLRANVHVTTTVLVVKALSAGDLPSGDRLVVGLNPPFGKESGVGGDFTEHAARQFRPRLIVLIVPPSVPVRCCYCALLLRHAACQGFQALKHLPAAGAHFSRCAAVAV